MEAGKSLAERLAECKQIRGQLEELGTFTNSVNQVKFKDASNAWVKDGVPSTTTLTLDAQKQCRVVLRLSVSRQSGITLER
jgi:hypothetical protein